MPTVFVVEDDASLRDELKRLLDLQGYACRTTTDFGRAADEIVAARPDCVVLDLKLPGAGGHAVCRDVRRKSAVPIIMLTSSDSEFDEVMSMNLGADDYVTKPYRPGRFARTHRSRPAPRGACRHAAGRRTQGRRARRGEGDGRLRGTRRRADAQRIQDPAHAHGEPRRHHHAPGAHVRAVAVRRVHRRQHAHRQHQPVAQEPGRHRRADDFLVTRRGQGYLV